MNLDAPPITAEFAFSRVAEYGGTGDEMMRGNVGWERNPRVRL